MTTPIYQAPAGGEDDPNAWFPDARCAPAPGATPEEIEAVQDIFFPGQGVSTEPARAICRECPVQPECLDYALTERIKHGIFGGMSERERRKIRSATKRVKCLECGIVFPTGNGGGTIRKTCSELCMVKRRRRGQIESQIRRSYIS